MNAQHSPTPWTYEPTFDGRDGEGEIDGYNIISDLKTIVGREGLYSDFEADAAFIVRACNAHDDLVAELRGMIQWAHALAKGQSEEAYEIVHNSPRMLKAQAALAKAGQS